MSERKMLRRLAETFSHGRRFRSARRAGRGQTKPASAPSEAAGVAQRVWGKLLTHCGEDYYYAGSLFDGAGIAADVQVNKTPIKVHFRGVRFTVVPIAVTEADRLNGVSARARIAMIARVYKSQFEDRWMDGPGLQVRNMNDIFGQALSSANADMFEMGSGGAIALELVKFKGAWSVARSSVSMSGPLMGSGFYDLQNVVAARLPTVDCKTGALIPPAKTAAEIAGELQYAGTKAEAEEKRRRDVADAARSHAEFEAKQEAEAQASHQAFLEQQKRNAPWVFRGSAAEFKTALESNLQKRAAQYGFDPKDYRVEMNQIMPLLADCLVVSAANYKAAYADFLAQRGPGPNLFQYMGSRFHGCGEGKPVHLSPSGKRFALSVARTPTARSNDHPEDLDAVSFSVFLEPSPDEVEKAGFPKPQQTIEKWFVIAAEVVKPTAPAGAGGEP